jgi:hypothetical protein
MYYTKIFNMIAVDLKLAIFIYDIERLFYKTILITG